MTSLSQRDLHLPDLRFVPTDSLVPHEQHDDQRMQPLVEKFREEAVLKNPPVVTPLTTNGEPRRYMVLDGANRSSAARAAGLPHLVVQVVRYDDVGVVLGTWSHALEDFPHVEFDFMLERVPGLTLGRTSLLGARAQLARRDALAYVRYADGEVETLHGGRDLVERNALLNVVVDVYRKKTRFQRVTGDSIEETRARHPEVTALVVFPHYEPAEILELATSGARLPAGISRHLIRWRALRVNVPMEWMQDATRTIEQKNEQLAEWLQQKFADRRVRFYEEPTVLFDE